MRSLMFGEYAVRRRAIRVSSGTKATAFWRISSSAALTSPHLNLDDAVAEDAEPPLRRDDGRRLVLLDNRRASEWNPEGKSLRLQTRDSVHPSSNRRRRWEADGSPTTRTFGNGFGRGTTAVSRTATSSTGSVVDAYPYRRRCSRRKRRSTSGAKARLISKLWPSYRRSTLGVRRAARFGIS